MSNLKEEFISRERVFDGEILHVVKDEVLLPNGRRASREICLHNGAVAIIPILSDGCVIMERQYRYALDRVFLEIPAGKLDFSGEDPLLAAARELREETGAVAARYTHIGRLITSPALVSEVIDMYLAEDISFTERELDEDEFIDVEKISLDELHKMVMSGEITDAKTQIAVLKAREIIKGRGN